MKSLLFSFLIALGFTASAQTYCAPSFSSGCVFGHYISLVNVGGLTNTATGCTVWNYTNMTANLSSGVATPMSVKIEGWTGIAVFIDLNMDGDLSDPNELLYGQYTAQAAHTYNFNITVPPGTPGGNHRMRVMCGWGGSANNPADPCKSIQYGWYHDYTAYIAPSLPNDAGVGSIISPTSDCDGSTQNVVVEVKNYGINQINTVDVHWTVNSVSQTPYTLTTLLDTANGTGSNSALATIGSLSLAGGTTYDIEAWTEMPNNQTDGFNDNDTSYASPVGYNYPVVNLGLDTSTCPNDLITLNAGGGRDSIRWDNGNTTASQLADTARTYIVEVWKNGCAGGDTISITHFPAPPTVDLGNDTMICSGDSIILDATTPGVSYLWHDGSPFPFYEADTIGNYSVIIEDINTCKNSDDINVSLFGQPAISMSVVPRNNLCFGSPYEFRASSFTQGSTMYQWKVNTVNSGSPTTNNKFQPTLTYGDSVNVELITDVCNASSYSIPSNYITMYINPEPKLISGKSETDTVLENTSKNYLVSIVQGSTFTWTAIGGSISSPIGNAVAVDWLAATPSAKILVTEKDNGNCSYTNERNVVIISTVGIKDEGNQIGVGNAYPNPANATVTIPLVVDGNWNIDLSLYDMTGKKVKTIYNGEVSGNRDFTFEVNDLKNGMYFYKVSTVDGYESVKKISVQH